MAAEADREQRGKESRTEQRHLSNGAQCASIRSGVCFVLHIAMYFILLYCIGGIQQLNLYRSNNVYKFYVIVCEREWTQ